MIKFVLGKKTLIFFIFVIQCIYTFLLLEKKGLFFLSCVMHFVFLSLFFAVKTCIYIVIFYSFLTDFLYGLFLLEIDIGQ